MHFIDSNVLLGYYFHIADTWGLEATNLFNSGRKLYAGKFSYEECFGYNGLEGRCRTKNIKIRSEFRRAAVLVKEGSDLDDLLKCAEEKEWNIISCLLCLKLDLLDFGADKIGLNEAITALKERFVLDCAKNMDEIIHTVSFHLRTDPYSEVHSELEQIGDPDDIEVILDAHDFCKSNTIISFVSGDFIHVIRHSEYIMDKTNIPKIEPLSNWNKLN